jgi:hypothetical protein
MIWTIIITISIILLVIIVIGMLYLIQIMYETQIQIIKDHYEMSMLMASMYNEPDIYKEEESSTTTVEVIV